MFSVCERIFKKNEFRSSKVVDFTDFEETPLTDPASTFRRLNHQKTNKQIDACSIM